MEDLDKNYLTEADLNALEKAKIKDSSYEVVRDLFLIGYESGLKYSD
jgi:hypothetical protein